MLIIPCIPVRKTPMSNKFIMISGLYEIRMTIVYFTNINMQNKISYLNVVWGLYKAREKYIRNKKIMYLLISYDKYSKYINLNQTQQHIGMSQKQTTTIGTISTNHQYQHRNMKLILPAVLIISYAIYNSRYSRDIQQTSSRHLMDVLRTSSKCLI